ncbi:hypothetical protein ACHAPJ_003893 [Fusarium lateritium]
MRPSTLFSSAALIAQAASAAVSTKYTDADTGITFQQWTDPASNFTFGIALPTKPTTDFIGQITAPISEGYAAVGMGSSMAKKLQVVAWPNDGKVVTSVRQATGYTNPAPLKDDTVVIKPIEKGVSVGADSFTYTFLCKGCIKTDGTTFKASDSNAVLGFAVSKTALASPSDASGALNYHGLGFGGFSLDTAAAQSADYETWAKLASDATTGTSPGTTTGGSATNFTTVTSNATYDYIVVGGGAAGLIVAQRLVETKKSVLLLEQGKASFYSSGGRSTMDWNDTTTQYDVPAMGYYLSSAKDTTEYCTDTAGMAGCVLGGGTAVNAMMFVRPQPADFNDKWPAGWKWEDVSGSADKLYERTPGTTSPTSDKKLVDQGAFDVLSKFFSGNGFTQIDAIEQPGKKKSVFTHPPIMVNNGLRAGPVRDYLPLAQQSSNFKLQLNTKVLRVIRDGKTVTGIEIQSGPSTRQIIKVKDNGAVILAAGALSTPRLLVNSGIGPAEQIQAVSNGSQRITVPSKDQWIDLPVGKNLKDHPIFTVKLKTKQSLTAMTETDVTSPSQTNIDLYAQGAGLLAQSGQRFIFWDSVTGSDGVERYVQGTCSASADDTIKLKVYLTHGATSSSSLTVTSSGATVQVSEPYMKTAGDKEAIQSFMKKIIEFASKPNSTLSIASNATAESLTSEYISGSHYVGTARMGAENDGNSVVDTDAKVWGTENLFVVDASIHPDLPTGNTQAIVMVAAEHAAAKIIGNGNGAASPVVPSNGTVVAPTTTSVVESTSVPVSTPATKKPSRKCKSKRSFRQRRHA